MNTVVALSLAVGIAGGGGLWLLTIHFLEPRKLTLTERVAPWVSDVSIEAHAVALASAVRRNRRGRSISQRVSERLPRSVQAIVDGGARTQTLIDQAGLGISIPAWRRRVVETALFGLALGSVFAVVGVWAFHMSLIAFVAITLVATVGGIYVRRYLLARSARKRVAEILEELPALCELLAICLTAGAGFRDGLARVVERGDGPLLRELRSELERVRLGIPIVDALAHVSARLDIAPLARMLDHVMSSIERGTPLADVLRVQAAESRAEAGRRLQERASAREVVMLLPLIFLILPITIAFAIFPGLLVIQTGL